MRTIALVVVVVVVIAACAACNVLSGVECAVDEDCHGTKLCVEGACVECGDDDDCDRGHFCDDGDCLRNEGGEGEGIGGEGEGIGGEGEGIGGEGEGEGIGGEGEGAEGEGVFGEGEGAEGEGVFGEGEGEGDPNHDEDADSVADSDDNCPTVSNIFQDDGDSDNVGDACDPHPTTPGDIIAAFESFSTNVPSTATIVAGEWSVSGDALHQTSTTGPAMIVEDSFPLADVVVEVNVAFDSEGTLPVNAGPLARASASGESGYLCDMFDDGFQTELLFHVVSGNAAGGALDSATTSVDVFNAHRLVTSVTGDRITCDLDGVTTSAIDTSFSQGGVGLRTNRVAATFTSLIVYASF